MIGHEAVRNDFYAPVGGGTQKLLNDLLGSHEVREPISSLEGAHRQENAIGSNIAALVKARRTSIWHAPMRAIFDPARLKPSRYEGQSRSAKAFALRGLKPLG
jgi:hypothetical protein